MQHRKKKWPKQQKSQPFHLEHPGTINQNHGPSKASLSMLGLRFQAHHDMQFGPHLHAANNGAIGKHEAG